MQIHVYENAYLFISVIHVLDFFTHAIDKFFFFQFSIYGFIMTDSQLKQMRFSSNAATVCNMFLFRLFVRIFCYYCQSLVLTNAGLTPKD